MSYNFQSNLTKHLKINKIIFLFYIINSQSQKVVLIDELLLVENLYLIFNEPMRTCVWEEDTFVWRKDFGSYGFNEKTFTFMNL